MLFKQITEPIKLIYLIMKWLLETPPEEEQEYVPTIWEAIGCVMHDDLIDCMEQCLEGQDFLGGMAVPHELARRAVYIVA